MNHLKLFNHSFKHFIYFSFLSLILGPVFNGKTTELFHRLEKWKIASRKILFIQHISVSMEVDSKYIGVKRSYI